ncbi:MAG: hypothetical protein CO095_15860, partial [Armatimonadetes bacterium CG_4_9_14_3_um_filter_58_7]
MSVGLWATTRPLLSGLENVQPHLRLIAGHGMTDHDVRARTQIEARIAGAFADRYWLYELRATVKTEGFPPTIESG